MTLAEVVKEKPIEIEMGPDWECPICAKNPPFNAKTIAAMEESNAIDAGKIPAKAYHSFEEFLKDLKN